MATILSLSAKTEDDFRGNIFRNYPISLLNNYDVLSLVNPYLVELVHESYLSVGADIISTNTFNASIISQSIYGLEKYSDEMNYRSAMLAKRIAERWSTSEKPRYVAGVIGPTAISLSKLRESNMQDYIIHREKMIESYYHQASALLSGGVDILLLETIFDLENALVAMHGIEKAMNSVDRKMPIAFSATINDSGCLASGENMMDFYNKLSAWNPFAIGLNCCTTVQTSAFFIESLMKKIPQDYGIYYPSIGIPSVSTEKLCDADEFASIVASVVKTCNIRIVGGCCGTTPLYIARLATALKNNS